MIRRLWNGPVRVPCAVSKVTGRRLQRRPRSRQAFGGKAVVRAHISCNSVAVAGAARNGTISIRDFCPPGSVYQAVADVVRLLDTRGHGISESCSASLGPALGSKRPGRWRLPAAPTRSVGIPHQAPRAGQSDSAPIGFTQVRAVGHRWGLRPPPPAWCSFPPRR